MKRILAAVCAVALIVGVTGCAGTKKQPKIGVSLGVGGAPRWAQEQAYMEACAKKLGAAIEVRLNKTDKPRTQQQDCFEMIDSGIEVLILTPRDIDNVKEIVEYAKEKNVKVINYARAATNERIDLFVGYDYNRNGQSLGQYLSEMVDKGDYILLRGDPGDDNAMLLYEGAMSYISPIKNDINIILDKSVEGWSAEIAKKLVLEAVKANGNKVDAILAPNDVIAGACVQALEELNVTSHVVITGMDAELDAAKRIVAGKQDVTIYMDIKELAEAAVNAAYSMATNKDADINAKFENGVEGGVDAHLLTGRLVTKENLDKVLIESGYFRKKQVYP